MPFNSPYNDYMYVIDEYNNLGWFASDRYQPEGKGMCICIHPCLIQTEYTTMKAMDNNKLIKSGPDSIRMRDTWTDKKPG